MTIDGIIIASKTKIIPNDSIKPNFVPKIAQLMTTDAAGSVVAVIEASSAVKNFKPALKLKNAPTVPTIIIQITSKITSESKNPVQFQSFINKNVDKPPKNIPTPVKNSGSIFFANKCFGNIALKANAAPLNKLHTTQPIGTSNFVGLPPVTSKKTPMEFTNIRMCVAGAILIGISFFCDKNFPIKRPLPDKHKLLPSLPPPRLFLFPQNT